VLAVQERQVDGGAAGERECLAVLLDTRADHRSRVGRAREPIPPAECSRGGLTCEDVHHEHLAGARQQMPT